MDIYKEGTAVTDEHAVRRTGPGHGHAAEGIRVVAWSEELRDDVV